MSNNQDDRNQKILEIERLRKIVNTRFTDSSIYAGSDLCHTYLNIADRQKVIEALHNRYPHATGNLITPEEWAEKMRSLSGPQNYISAFAGEVGEEAAVVKMESLGADPERFESRTHPDTDIVDHNTDQEWSVKSYHDPDQFMRVLEASDAEKYIVNEELYRNLEESGKLDELSDQGFEILNGGFSHENNVQLAQERLEAMAESGGIADEVHDNMLSEIPVITGIIGLCNAGLTYNKYSSGKLSGHEASVDLLCTVGRVGAAGGGAAAGSMAGAAIGSAIFPLAGTLIGGGVGAFLGSTAARGIITSIKDYWKWGASTAAYDYFSEQYADGFTANMNQRCINRYLHFKRILEMHQQEEEIVKRYASELALNNPTTPTMAAVLSQEAHRHLAQTVDSIASAKSKIFSSLCESYCWTWADQRFHRKREETVQAMKRLYGAFIAENADWLLTLSSQEKELIDAMKKEQRDSPHNAYQLRENKDTVLGALVVALLMNSKTK